jgi:formylglycine-generating enzyme required for sulfatase activity
LFFSGSGFKTDASTSWQDPGFSQTDRDPVVCVSWDDANAYAVWLSRTTGKPYRLLSETEWEYAARAGTTTEYYWGDSAGSGHADCSGCGSRWDRKSTAPAGSFAPNAFGLYDMAGNAWQRVEDCYLDNYRETPTDGSPYTEGPCEKRVARGGSGRSDLRFVRAAYRGIFTLDTRDNFLGFRLARTVTP